MVMRSGYRSMMLAATLAAAALLPSVSMAGLFDDDEARRAILDIRTKLDAKADKSGVLELANQNELLRQEVAKLRGQVEMLTNEVANAQRRQKDFYVELDNRTRKLEPQQVVVDGKEVVVEPGEQAAYDAAMAQFKAADYKAAGNGFSDFVKRYPRSGYVASAQYFLGTAFYAQRDYRNAISAQWVVVRQHSNSARAPDALLNIASSYTEIKDKHSARKTLEKLVAQYPNSEAAKTAKERLAAN